MIISIIAQKGGTGKTTTAATMGAALTMKGYKVLLVDLDPQGSLSSITGASRQGKTILGVLGGEVTANEAIQTLPIGNVIPANKTLVGADPLLKETGGEYRLREVLEPIASTYDFVIIDSPPALGSLTINAMTAADSLIIPAQADILSLEGIAALHDSYKLVKKYTNNNLTIAGILLTKHSNRAVLKRDLEEVLRTQTAPGIGTKVFKATIREAVAINEAQYERRTIFDYAPKSKIAEDYNIFIDELLVDLKGRF